VVELVSANTINGERHVKSVVELVSASITGRKVIVSTATGTNTIVMNAIKLSQQPTHSKTTNNQRDIKRSSERCSSKYSACHMIRDKLSHNPSQGTQE
jgi:hypothetical protein